MADDHANEYPRMLYHSETGAERIVGSRDEHRAATQDGFGDDPAPYIARRDRSVVPPVHKSGQDDLIDRMRALLVEFFGEPDSATDRPRRGRPPNVSMSRAASRDAGTEQE